MYSNHSGNYPYRDPNPNPNQRKKLCIIQCNNRVWNPNLNPSPSPLVEMSRLHPKGLSVATLVSVAMLALPLVLEYIVTLENRSQTHSKNHNVFQYNNDSDTRCVYTLNVYVYNLSNSLNV